MDGVTVLSAVGYVVLPVLFAIACIKGKLRWGGFVGLIWTAWLSVVITLILAYANPLAGADGQFQPIFVLPAIVAGVMLLLAMFALTVQRSTDEPPKEKPPIARWGAVVVAVVLYVCGVTAFSSCIFVIQPPNPLSAIIAWLALIAITSVCLYAISRMNSSQRQNGFRWLAFFLALILIGANLTHALMLIFGYPGAPPRQALGYASTMALGYMPPALVILATAREYVWSNEIEKAKS